MLATAALVLSLQAMAAQAAAQPPDAGALTAAIDRLGAFDDRERMASARTVRRAPQAQAVPALIRAVDGHEDGYVRFRAAVILTGFHDERTRDVMERALDDANDRLRAVAYAYFEHNTDPSIVPRLLKALDREESEFVRPALTRALAAYGTDARVRPVFSRLVMQGQDLFRSAVIEAAGDYKAAYALAPLMEVAKLDGPLQDDAVLALGKIGDTRALEVLASLQRTAPRERQPAVAAAICLLGVNCASHEPFLAQTLRFAMDNIGYQPLLRAAARGLAALGAAGREEATAALFEAGVPARDPARAPIALAVGTIALRNPEAMLTRLAGRHDARDAVLLLRDAFDMLEEDYEEERFFATIRREYWKAPEGSPGRTAAETLIQTLEF